MVGFAAWGAIIDFFQNILTNGIHNEAGSYLQKGWA